MIFYNNSWSCCKKNFFYHYSNARPIQYTRETIHHQFKKLDVPWIILWTSRNRYKRPCTRYIILNPKDLIQTSCSANEVNLDHSKGFNVDDLNPAYIISRSKDPVDSFKYFEMLVEYPTYLPTHIICVPSV